MLAMTALKIQYILTSDEVFVIRDKKVSIAHLER